MTVNDALRAIAGLFVLALGRPRRLGCTPAGTASPPSSGLNLLQSAFTRLVPDDSILRKLGLTG